MNTQVIWLLIGLILLILGTGVFLLIRKRNYSSFVQKCKNIEAPEGSSFYFGGIEKNKKGVTVHGFIAKAPSEGGPSVRIYIDNPYGLGNNLRIVFKAAKYMLLDVDNRVYY